MTKIDRAALRQKIQQLEGLTDEERSALMELTATKRYGLVWEEREEAVEERLREELPVLVEDESLRIENGSGPNHILIEGDNLEALTALSYTHEGKVDVIYIDPPYNTGNHDFVYNDSFVDSEDSYRHSKWLSFMSKRLRIAKRLLSDRGVIFISIDDNEQANLKLLCDEVFGEKGFVGNIIWQSRTSISNDDYISTNHNHTLIYSRNRDLIIFYGEKLSLEGYINPDNDPRGPWKLVPIDANHPGGDTIYGIINPKTGVEYYPPTNRIWAYSRDGMQKLMDDGRIKFGINDDSSPKKKLFYYERIEKGDTKTPSSVLIDAKTTKDGTNELIDILGEKKFDYPKPSDFIQRLLTYSSLYSKEHIVLDFFAGSGTTLHAVMQLNKEDGGKRQCILVTNNENNICREVTYERNRRVIEGYTTPKGVKVEGLKENNLRYYRTAFVPRERTNRNMHALVNTATDLLCIKENLYQELPLDALRHCEERSNPENNPSVRLKPKHVRLFSDGTNSMMIIYNEQAIPYIVEGLKRALANSQLQTPNSKLKIYVFSPGAYAWDDDFAPVIDRVELCALPEAIYQAYKNVLPTKRQKTIEIEPVEEGGEQ